jgi:hypothetical protein
MVMSPGRASVSDRVVENTIRSGRIVVLHNRSLVCAVQGNNLARSSLVRSYDYLLSDHLRRRRWRDEFCAHPRRFPPLRATPCDDPCLVMISVNGLTGGFLRNFHQGYEILTRLIQ